MTHAQHGSTHQGLVDGGDGRARGRNGGVVWSERLQPQRQRLVRRVRIAMTMLVSHTLEDLCVSRRLPSYVHSLPLHTRTRTEAHALCHREPPRLLRGPVHRDRGPA